MQNPQLARVSASDTGQISRHNLRFSQDSTPDRLEGAFGFNAMLTVER